MVSPTNNNPEITNEDNPQIEKVYYTKSGKPYVKKYEHVMYRKGLFYDSILDIKSRLLQKTGQDVPLKIIYLIIKYFFTIIAETLAKGKPYKLQNFGVFKPLVVKEKLTHRVNNKIQEWGLVETHLSCNFSAADPLKRKLRGVNLKNPELLENLPKKEKSKLTDNNKK